MFFLQSTEGVVGEPTTIAQGRLVPGSSYLVGYAGVTHAQSYLPRLLNVPR